MSECMNPRLGSQWCLQDDIEVQEFMYCHISQQDSALRNGISGHVHVTTDGPIEGAMHMLTTSVSVKRPLP
jgi:hypothetical protein